MAAGWGSAIGSLPFTAIFLLASLLSLSFASVPTLAVNEGVEGAWTSLLGYAHQKGLQYGPEIVYPYGPLGFLITPHFNSETRGLRMFVDIVLAFGIAYGVCLVAWRSGRGWRALLLTVFAVLAANIEYAPQDMIINIGLLAWGFLCITSSRLTWVSCVPLVLLASFSSLAKVSGLILAGFTVTIVCIDLWLRVERRTCLSLICSYLACVAGGWTMADQKFSNLPMYLSRGVLMSSGYEQTMGLEPPVAVLVCGALVLCIAIAASIVGSCCWNPNRAPFLRRILLGFWLSVLGFLTWKHGFVRADPHHNCLYLGFVAVLLLLSATLGYGDRKLYKWSLYLSSFGAGLAVFTIQMTIYPEHLRLLRPFERLTYNVKSVLHPSVYREKMRPAEYRTGQLVELPRLCQTIGTATVDVFGNEQSYGVLNHLNFHPRPIFQSYAASTLALMRINEAFYSSPGAPEYVLFKVDPLDHRYAPLEDALLFRYLVFNYRLTGSENGVLLFERQKPRELSVSLLKEGVVQPEQLIDLSAYGDKNIWLEVDLHPTLVGNLRRFLYQPEPIELSVSTGERAAKPQVFTAPQPMLSAGFLASPLFSCRDDVARFCQGKPVTRPAGYSIKIRNGGIRMWETDIHFRIFLVNKAVEAPKSRALEFTFTTQKSFASFHSVP